MGIGRLFLGLSCLLGAWGFSSCASKKTVQQTETVGHSYEEVRKYDYFFLEATRQREKGNYAEALDLYEHCLALNPQSAATMYELAQFYMYLGRSESVRTLLENAVTLQPDNFWYRQTLGAYYRNVKEEDKAIVVYEQMAERFPARTEVLMILFDLYSQKKDFSNVIRTLDLLEQKEGKNEQISMEKFRAYLQMQDKDNAFREIINLSEEYPNDMRYRILLGDNYLENGDTTKAYNIFTEVLRTEPDNAMAQLSLAAYYERQGKDSLLHAIQDSLLMNPKLDMQTRQNVMRRIILQTEQSGGDTQRVLQLFEKQLAMPQEDATIAMLCYGYMQHKKMTDAETRPVLEKVLEIEPDNAAARYSLLMMAVRKEDYEEVARLCGAAIQYAPENLVFYYYQGISYYQMKRHVEALEVLRRGVGQMTRETEPALVSDFYSMIGDLCHTTGDTDAAYAAYDSALVYNPGNMGVLNNYAYFLSLEKRDLDKAEEMSFKTVKAEPKNNTYLDTYAWILFEKKRYAEAGIYIDEAMKNGGDESATIVEHCGDIHYMLDEKDKAMEYWKKASEMEHESKTLERKIREKRYIAE